MVVLVNEVCVGTSCKSSSNRECRCAIGVNVGVNLGVNVGVQ